LRVAGFRATPDTNMELWASSGADALVARAGDAGAITVAGDEDVARGIVTHKISGSLSAAHASHELQRHYELRDGVLTLTFTRLRNGLPVTHVLSFRRVSPEKP